MSSTRPMRAAVPETRPDADTTMPAPGPGKTSSTGTSTSKSTSTSQTSSGKTIAVESLAAIEFGRVAALAGHGHRDLARVTARYPELFPARPFDPAMLATIAYATAACAPWLSRAGARMVNLVSLWLFGLDLRTERLTPAAVRDLRRRCLAVADGADAQSGDQVGEMLALVRDRLAGTVPGFTSRSDVWREALSATLTAVVRERTWTTRLSAATRGRPPSPAEYLDNAASTGFAVVFSVLWLIDTAGREAFGANLTAAVDAAQRVLRLVNDLGSYGREMESNDVNVLRLGMTRAELTVQIATATDRLLDLAAVVRSTRPRLATYVERQVGFAVGLYGAGDFWGQR
jgi:hypothetical protein